MSISYPRETYRRLSGPGHSTTTNSACLNSYSHKVATTMGLNEVNYCSYGVGKRKIDLNFFLHRQYYDRIAWMRVVVASDVVVTVGLRSASRLAGLRAGPSTNPVFSILKIAENLFCLADKVSNKWNGN